MNITVCPCMSHVRPSMYIKEDRAEVTLGILIKIPPNFLLDLSLITLGRIKMFPKFILLCLQNMVSGQQVEYQGWSGWPFLSPGWAGTGWPYFCQTGLGWSGLGRAGNCSQKPGCRVFPKHKLTFCPPGFIFYGWADFRCANHPCRVPIPKICTLART